MFFKNFIQIKILLFLLFSNSLTLVSIGKSNFCSLVPEVINNDNANVSENNDDEDLSFINGYISDINQMITQANEDIAKINQEIEKENERAHLKLLNSIKDSNTILLDIFPHVKLFKGDISKIIVFAIGFYLENLLLNKVKQNKVDIILNSILGDSKNFYNILYKAKEVIKRDAQEKKGIFRKIKDMVLLPSKPKELVDFENYINKNHSYSFFDSYKISFLPFFVLSYFNINIISYIESFLISNINLGSFDNHSIEILTTSLSSYKKDKENNFIQQPDFNISILSLIDILFFNSYMNYKKIYKGNNYMIDFCNCLAKNYIKLPEFMYSKKFFTLLNILAMGYSIKLFSNIFDNDWRSSLLKDDFVLDKIYEYNNLEDNDYHKRELEIELRSYILSLFNKKSSISNFRSWRSCLNTSNNRFDYVKLLPSFCCVGYLLQKIL